MRRAAVGLVLVVVWAASCATAEDQLTVASDGGGSGGKGGGVGGFSATGGTSATGGSGGSFGGSGGSFGGSGGSFGGTGGSFGGTGGLDASTDAGDGAIPGFGPCVTQAEIDSQSSQPLQVGFCFNPFACIFCSDDAVLPGDIVCSPNCLCLPLPPLCTDAGIDASDDAEDTGAAGAPADASVDVSSD